MGAHVVTKYLLDAVLVHSVYCVVTTSLEHHGQPVKPPVSACLEALAVTVPLQFRGIAMILIVAIVELL